MLWGINEKPLYNHKVLLQVKDTINIYSLNPERFVIAAAVFVLAPLRVPLKNVACVSVMMAFRPLLHQSQGRTFIATVAMSLVAAWGFDTKMVPNQIIPMESFSKSSIFKKHLLPDQS